MAFLFPPFSDNGQTKSKKKKKKINTPLLSVSSPITVYAGTLDDRKEACSFPITETRTLHQQLLKKKKRKEKTKKKRQKKAVKATFTLRCRCLAVTGKLSLDRVNAHRCLRVKIYMRICVRVAPRPDVQPCIAVIRNRIT